MPSKLAEGLPRALEVWGLKKGQAFFCVHLSIVTLRPLSQLIDGLNRATTPLEKIMLLSKTVAQIMGQAASADGAPVTADQLVPLLCLLVVRSDNANWIANISYIRHVRWLASFPWFASVVLFLS